MKQMKNKLFVGWLFKISAIIFLITPILILTLIKRDVWFINGANKVSIGFIIALIFCLMMLKGAFKNLNKNYATIISLLVFSVIVWLLDTVISDLFWILICAFIGYVIYLVVDTLGSRLLLVYRIYSDEHIKSQAKDDYIEIKGNGRA